MFVGVKRGIHEAGRGTEARRYAIARDLRDWRRVSSEHKVNTEMRNKKRIDRSGPLPDYDHHTHLLAVGAAVLDLA
jgi:hypothetical protein